MKRYDDSQKPTSPTTPSRKCSRKTADGAKCRAWAIRGSNPAVCSTHARATKGAGAPAANTNAATHGFYSRAYTLEEIADLVNFALDDTLDDELSAARVAVRRVLTALEEQLTPGEYAELAGLIFTGTNTIARLLRTRRALAGQSADGIAGAIATALDELATEWNVEL